MKKEYFIDRISNVSVQGPVVSVDLGRMISEGDSKDTFTLDPRLTVTMTGSNFIALVNTLNNTVKAISERQKSSQPDENSSTKPAKLKSGKQPKGSG